MRETRRAPHQHTQPQCGADWVCRVCQWNASRPRLSNQGGPIVPIGHARPRPAARPPSETPRAARAPQTPAPSKRAPAALAAGKSPRPCESGGWGLDRRYRPPVNATPGPDVRCPPAHAHCRDFYRCASSLPPRRCGLALRFIVLTGSSQIGL